MTLVSNFFMAVGLSADAFAVSVARGACSWRADLRVALRTGLVFGGVEASMVLLGWLLGAGFAGLIADIDHWIALVLLGAVGGHMIHEGLGDGDEDVCEEAGKGGLKTLLAALGTSIDGAAIGVTLAFMSVHIWSAVAIVGVVSFCISTLGVLIGPRIGALLGRRAEILGGLVLITIGVTIFYSHMRDAGLF
ncbi:Putative Mn2+ efflux pump MntP [Modicisalibacter ilicicola DSM 19980]|uniref:Putative manganese efflux pump MntP n=1 Tax=Modicisalibacter ilicicola DSM 19980 TaxID=1121942 RepID=A0A1M5DNR2_9GAMM|nr:manganese efflux pump MntP family protein [Halomonas ilicicola]SHF68627.1 Putative Mn2+ efflux pump MntP [Halomonas ilicicola DSM 19980]